MKAPAVVKINDRGHIVGSYSENTAFVSDPNARLRGFPLDHGRFIRIEVRGAVETLAAGINNRGQVVGGSQDAGGTFHGFLWKRRFKVEKMRVGQDIGGEDGKTRRPSNPITIDVRASW